ncbi:MAG: histidine kinase [Acidimicrobiales bacterium]
MAVALAGAALALVVAQPAGRRMEVGEWLVVQFVPGFVLSGWWLSRRRPQLPLGWLFLVAAVTLGLSSLGAAWTGMARANGWAGPAWGLWIFSWLWQPHTSLLNAAYLLFPDGRVRTRPQRWLLRFTYGDLLVGMALSAIHPGAIVTTPDKPDGAFPDLLNPLGVGALDGFFDAADLPIMVLRAVIGLSPIVWVLWQWRHSEGVRRRQFRWLSILSLISLVVPIAVIGAPQTIGPAVAIAQTLATQLLIVVAILQWRAYEVDVVVRRSVLAASLLAAGLTVYGAVVLAVSVLLGRTGPVASAAGAAVAILAFGPMSVSIRRGVNRLFYGRRDDPYLVVSEAGRRLAGASDPRAGIAAVVTALTEQLRVPYAAVVGAGGEVLAESGEAGEVGERARVPVVHQGSALGVLHVGHRRGTVRMTADESALLVDLANQLGPALAALGLIEGLRSAQQRLVVARDEERRRIQRDLHDGLGSALTAVTLKLDAARNHLGGGDSAAATDLVGTARSDVQAALGDVRRLVYSLGDPTLTAKGLSAGLQDRVQALTRGTDVRLELAIDDVGRLAPHLEEAVYRIVVEAVTNVVRHAGAGACRVTLALDGPGLSASVVDDGCGIDGRAPGVGRLAMEARAAEIGGELVIGPGAAGAGGGGAGDGGRAGTRVELWVAREAMA